MRRGVSLWLASPSAAAINPTGCPDASSITCSSAVRNAQRNGSSPPATRAVEAVAMFGALLPGTPRSRHVVQLLPSSAAAGAAHPHRRPSSGCSALNSPSSSIFKSALPSQRGCRQLSLQHAQLVALKAVKSRWK